MPPPSPLPQREGLNAAWIRTPDATVPALWPTLRDWLWHKVGRHVDVDQYLAQQRFVLIDGSPVLPGAPYRPNTFVWFYRELRPEPPVPGRIHVLHRDERIVVVDKPPFLSTIPRGRHVVQSVVTRLRRDLELPELSPAHRLDRVTSGVLLLVVERRWRGAYQTMFQEHRVYRTYQALAPELPGVEFPLTVANHLRKERGRHAVTVLPGAEVNARSVISVAEVLGEVARYELRPLSGKTHQLRQHMMSIGAPILNDPLYPVDLNVAVDDFRRPLQLLAHRMRFEDPVDGSAREFVSRRRLPLGEEGADACGVS